MPLGGYRGALHNHPHNAIMLSHLRANKLCDVVLKRSISWRQFTCHFSMQHLFQWIQQLNYAYSLHILGFLNQFSTMQQIYYKILSG